MRDVVCIGSPLFQTLFHMPSVPGRGAVDHSSSHNFLFYVNTYSGERAGFLEVIERSLAEKSLRTTNPLR